MDRATSPDAPPADAALEDVELSIVMPCLDEAETLATCIRKAQRFLAEHRIAGEVIVADNGSTDGSPEIARRLGARVVHVTARGYGNALRAGIAAARGRFVVMGDADDSYDFLALAPFLQRLRDGYDLVMGNRFRGGILPGAMPWHHKFVGNPLLTSLGRLFFRSPCGDFHCGLRAFRKAAIERLHLSSAGMEFASEMVVKATLRGLRITEVPTTLAPDGRSRPPHLRSFRDGWRHLRFLLLACPRWLFLYPGLLLILLGFGAGLWLLPGPRTVGGVTFDVHTLIYAAAAILMGFEAVVFAAFSAVFAVSAGLLPEDPRLTRLMRWATLERGILAGGLLLLAGLGVSLFAFAQWGAQAFGDLDPRRTLRLVVPAATAMALGCQVVFASFFLALLRQERR